MKKIIVIFVLTFFFLNSLVTAQENQIQQRLVGFDKYMEKIFKDWNAPGAGIGIVYKDKLIFAEGYGYRDYEKKLPITANTLFQIASNTKLFTATAIGLLVNEGKLDWDKPIHDYIPSIEFYNDELNNTITLRDMLSHRTGISRHDMIWYQADFTRKELFEKLKYLEPCQPIRTGFLYNNLMYDAGGYIIELITNKTWEEFVKEKIFQPLEMTNTIFSINEMLSKSDYFVPFNEKRDTTILYKIPYYSDDGRGTGPEGSIISSINDMSKWLIAQMSGGKYKGIQVIPENIIQATMTPAIYDYHNEDRSKGYFELLIPNYGMGRNIASYRGHFITYHGGDVDGIHSQISFMPKDSIGVIVFTIGDHTYPLYNIISFNIYERLLGLEQTPWSQRKLADYIKEKEANKKGRSAAEIDRVPDTKPSHPIKDYTGQFENDAYGIINISLKNKQLQFDFHHIVLPLNHYHYDRFDTPDDELYGKWSVNFLTNPQGDIDKIVMSLDEGETSFIRKVDSVMTNPEFLSKYVGNYELAGTFVDLSLKNENKIYIKFPGQPSYELIPYKKDRFRLKQFSDTTIHFVVKNENVTAFDMTDPTGIKRYIKK